MIYPSIQGLVNVAVASQRGASVSRSISRPARDRRAIAEWLVHLMVFLSGVRAG